MNIQPIAPQAGLTGKTSSLMDLATAPDTPEMVLLQVAATTNVAVARELAARDNISARVALVLTEHYSAAVRLALANNPHTPERALLLLMNDAHPDVRLAAKKNGAGPASNGQQASHG